VKRRKREPAITISGDVDGALAELPPVSEAERAAYLEMWAAEDARREAERRGDEAAKAAAEASGRAAAATVESQARDWTRAYYRANPRRAAEASSGSPPALDRSSPRPRGGRTTRRTTRRSRSSARDSPDDPSEPEPPGSRAAVAACVGPRGAL
jgi:hypothetical protein